MQGGDVEIQEEVNRRLGRMERGGGCGGGRESRVRRSVIRWGVGTREETEEE